MRSKRAKWGTALAAGCVAALALAITAAGASALSLAAPTAGSATSDTTPAFSWTAATGATRYDLLVDNIAYIGVPAVMGAFTLSYALDDGPHAWTMRATDADGHSSTLPWRSFFVDTWAPTGLELGAPGDGDGADSRPTLSWAAAKDATSGIAGYGVVIDSILVASLGPTATSYQPPSVLGSGHHSWFVYAVDKAGNQQTAKARSFTVRTGVWAGEPTSASPKCKKRHARARKRCLRAAEPPR